MPLGYVNFRARATGTPDSVVPIGVRLSNRTRTLARVRVRMVGVSNKERGRGGGETSELEYTDDGTKKKEFWHTWMIQIRAARRFKTSRILFGVILRVISFN